MYNINGIKCCISDFKIISIATNDSDLQYTVTNYKHNQYKSDSIEIIKNRLKIVGIPLKSIEMKSTNLLFNFCGNSDLKSIKNFFAKKYRHLRGFYGCNQWCNVFKIIYPAINIDDKTYMKLFENNGTIISKPKKFDSTRYFVYFTINDISMVNTWLDDIQLSTYKKQHLEISLAINTDLIPSVSTFEYLLKPVDEYIHELFGSKIKIKFNNNGNIKFICKDIGLQLQARSSIKNISKPTILQSDHYTLYRMLGDQIDNDHFHCPLLDITTHGHRLNTVTHGYHKIIVKKSTNQILLYGIPATRMSNHHYLQSVLNDPSIKILTIKIPILTSSHHKIIESYLKNIKPFITSTECECHLVNDYLIVNGRAANIEKTSKILQDIIANILQNEPGIHNDTSREKCVLCYNTVCDRIYLVTCNCIYCNECFKHMLFSRQTTCVSCQTTIDLSDLKYMNDIEISRIFTPILEEFLSTNKQYVRCLTPDCNSIYRNTGCKFIYCDSCCHVYCLECQNDYYGLLTSHDGLTCDMYKKKCKIDMKSQDWLNKNTKKCPHCASTIQRVEGCLHMKCSQCKYDFCWECLKKWSIVKHGFYNCIDKFNSDVVIPDIIPNSEEYRSDSEEYTSILEEVE